MSLAVKIDDPNITIEEYITLKEEKARRHGKVYNWETATYGKIWYNEYVHDLRSVETELPAIVFNDTLTSEIALSYEPMKTDSENDNDKVNVPLFLSSEPTVSYFDDFDYFKNFEKEYPAIVNNDTLTSKLDFSPEPTVSIQHVLRNGYGISNSCTALGPCCNEKTTFGRVFIFWNSMCCIHAKI
ncbi:hypothetical protein Tco_0289917 [Tanacetum coccineum]